MPDHPQNAVFVSYRRDVGGILAMALYQHLTDHGVDTFYDFESIRTGQFDAIVLGQIAARPYFLLVLTPGTLERCVEPGDWLRREIDKAVATNRVIVPAYTPNFDFDDFERFLPGELGKEVRRFNGLEMPQRWFKAAVQQLVEEYLQPIDLYTDPTPAADRPLVEQTQQRALAAPPVTDAQLAGQEYNEAISGQPEASTRESDSAPRLVLNRGNEFEGDDSDLEGTILDIGERVAAGTRPFYVLVDNFAAYVHEQIRLLEGRADRPGTRLAELKRVRRREREVAPVVNRCVGMIVTASSYKFFRRSDGLGGAFDEARWAAVGLRGLADEFWNFRLKSDDSILWWLWDRNEKDNFAAFVVSPPEAAQIMTWYWNRPERDEPGLDETTAYPVAGLSEDLLRRRGLPAIARLVSQAAQLQTVSDITLQTEFVRDRTDLDRWVFAQSHPSEVSSVRPPWPRKAQ